MFGAWLTEIPRSTTWPHNIISDVKLFNTQTPSHSKTSLCMENTRNELMVMVLFLLPAVMGRYSNWISLSNLKSINLKIWIFKAHFKSWIESHSQISNCWGTNLKSNLKTQRQQIRSKVFRLLISRYIDIKFYETITRIQRQSDSNLIVTDYYKQVFIVQQHHT